MYSGEKMPLPWPINTLKALRIGMQQQKSRIGVNFGINKFADFDVAEHTKIAQDVAGKSRIF